MSFSFQLNRAVQVTAIRFHGEVGFLERQPWVVAVAKMAAEKEREFSVADVSEHLLGGSLPLAKGLIQRCLALGLCEATEAGLPVKYRLTDAGSQAAQRGVIFLPRSGNWTIWYSEDQTLEARYLLVEPWREPSALDEAGRKRHVGNSRNFISAPDWLRNLTGLELNLPLAQRNTVKIINVMEKVEDAGDGLLDLQFTVSCRPEGCESRLIGRLRQPSRKNGEKDPEPKIFQSMPHPTKHSFDECWQALLESAGMAEQWDAQARALCVSFPEDHERTACAGWNEKHYASLYS